MVSTIGSFAASPRPRVTVILAGGGPCRQRPRASRVRHGGDRAAGARAQEGGMDLATVVWVLTALGGAVLYVIWLRHGGTRVEEPRAGGGVSNGRVAAHATFALSGLLFWVLAAAVEKDDQLSELRWFALGGLVIAMAIGIA